MCQLFSYSFSWLQTHPSKPWCWGGDLADHTASCYLIVSTNRVPRKGLEGWRGRKGLFCPLCLLVLTDGSTTTLHPGSGSWSQCLFLCPLPDPSEVQGTWLPGPSTHHLLFPSPRGGGDFQQILSLCYLSISFLYFQFSNVCLSNFIYWLLCVQITNMVSVFLTGPPLIQQSTQEFIVI